MPESGGANAILTGFFCVERVVLLVLDFEPEPPRLVPVARVVFGLEPVPARVVLGMEVPQC